MCKPLIVVQLNLLNINTAAACLATDLLTSVALPKPRILFTIVWCSTFRRNLMPNALRTWDVIPPNLFQELKTERALICPSLCSTMSVRRRRDTTEPPKLIRPPEFDTSNFYFEAVSPAFDPKMVLIRSLFSSMKKYVSVGFYPTRDYQTFLEFGAVNNGSTFLILNDQQVMPMVENLPRMYDSMWGDEQYGCKKGDFRLKQQEAPGLADCISINNTSA